MKLSGMMYAFNGGELSRRMEGRVDLDGIYDRGLAEMFNFAATVEGPAVKRSGFRHIRTAAASASFLSQFVFNVTQAYVLEWLDGNIRFYTNGGRIETDPDTPYEVEVPYAASEAWRVSSQQSYDRLYLAHGAYRPAALTRTGATTFTYAPLAFKNGPFKNTNSDKAITVTASGSFVIGGTATITASSPIFKAGQVGAPFMIEAIGFSGIKAWEPGYDAMEIGHLRRSSGHAYISESSGRTGTVQPTHTEGSEWDGTDQGEDVNGDNAGGILWRYKHDLYGMGTITAVDPDEMSATITVTRTLPDNLDTTPSYKWAHGAFSDAEGWPSLVFIGFGRMLFIKGLVLYASVVNDYGGGQVNFSPFTDSGLFTADMAFRRELELTDPPLWVKVDKEAILIGTAKGEYLITAINQTEPIAGDNVQALPQSRYGSAQVWPIDIGTAGLFVQRGGRKIREAEYSYERERFVGLNITVWARHITRSAVRQLAFQQEPEEMLWALRNDGVFAAHPHSPEQQIKGFARMQLGAGTALSAVAIPSDDGERDDLWVLADLDGDRHVLRLENWWEEDDELSDEDKLTKLKNAFFVDFGVSYSGEAKTEFTSGLDHLAGRDVWVLADGGVVPNMHVDDDGNLTLPRAASVVQIGIGYEARMMPMRPEIRGGKTQQGLRKRAVKLILRVIDASGLIVRDPVSGTDENLFDRPGSARMDQPIPLFNGDTENKAIGGGYDRRGQYMIISIAPLPAIVPAIIPTLEVEN